MLPKKGKNRNTMGDIFRIKLEIKINKSPLICFFR